MTLTVAVTVVVTVAVTVAVTMTMTVAVAVAVTVAVTMTAKGYAQTDCHCVDENWEVPWLQEGKNGTNHGKMGKSAGKWNQPWQNGEGEVHLETFTWHNTKRKYHNTACRL